MLISLSTVMKVGIVVLLSINVVSSFIIHPGNHPHHPSASPKRSSKGRSKLSASTAPAVSELEDAVKEKCAILQLNQWNVIAVSGEDRMRFLHNQLTNAFVDVKSGTVLEASYTTPTGRTIDLVTCLLGEKEVVLLSSPNRPLVEAFDKYIFPLDRVQIKDKTSSMSIYTVAGPLASHLLTKVFGDERKEILPDARQFTSLAIKGEGEEVLIAHGTGLALPGFIVICTSAAAGSLKKAIKEEEGVVEGGEEAWQALRILQGRPYPDKELTKDVTPLEACLYHTINFDKGCYLGQETIAKVANNKGERQRLYGVRVKEGEGALIEGARLNDKQGNRAGMITSVMVDGSRGLAYIRKIIADPLKEVLFMDGESSAGMKVEVVDIPYATHSPSPEAASPASSTKAPVETVEALAAKQAEAERKAKKLEEMKKKLEAFQAKQQQKKS